MAEIGEEAYRIIREMEQEVKIPDLSVFDDRGDITIHADGLYFPGEVKNEIRSQASQALQNGDHVLLVGPPGTGKSKLAKAICESVVDENYEFVTANSDWSTFDTVGGYHPEKDESLTFKPGVFLSRFKDTRGVPQNEWMIIDEINRADIDKAFGSLFSVLAGDDVTLSFTTDKGEHYEIRSTGDPNVGRQDNVYYVPDDWRMIATMNTFDKTSLYEMSYAFMRRWAFVSVPVPDLENHPSPERLVGNYVDVWREDSEPDDDKFGAIASIWRVVNNFRKIGPAIVEDIYDHVEHSSNPDYASALSMYVIPQLEGLPQDELEKFLSELREASIEALETEEVHDFMEDYFQTALEP